MAPRSRRGRASVRARPGVLGELLADATGVLQSVANEVAPGVVGAIDINDVVERVDIQEVVDRVDIQEVVGRVDLNEVLAKVDLDAVLARADLNSLIARIDVNAVIDKVDIDRVLERLDLNALLSRVDLEALVRRTEVGSIIASTGAGIASKAIDVARSEGVGLDFAVQRWADKILRRRSPPRLNGPPLLVDEPGGSGP
jgi:hypothetical protein